MDLSHGLSERNINIIYVYCVCRTELFFKSNYKDETQLVIQVPLWTASCIHVQTSKMKVFLKHPYRLILAFAFRSLDNMFGFYFHKSKR